ncbi:hypothetical protein Ahy_A07g034308 isoform C [Arachis hypogaea]|uniref:Uncharacterized protein n=1 Tax=Arachis hypogaea TaxID=3818 RepID=A0A445CBH1_ARAHY|nr:hypothetical protein Ahy_A07g034308 isoform C [Arachis hypogaea]
MLSILTHQTSHLIGWALMFALTMESIVLQHLMTLRFKLWLALILTMQILQATSLQRLGC